MKVLTIKGVPDALHRQLKRAAAANGRSLNRELLYRLAEPFSSRPVDPDEWLARADALRERIRLPYLSDEQLREAKRLRQLLDEALRAGAAGPGAVRETRLGFVGAGRDAQGKADVARRHDEYLYGTRR